ncbi:MAG: helix-turn-helix domain-containing protein [Pseudomonadales bacterium]|nr:helix-turn-helix domain-containing protein [Pseudomonadales bacterium]
MNAVAIEREQIIESFTHFSNTSKQYLNIKSEEDYEKTVALMKHIMLNAADDNDALWSLLDVLASSVEKYEKQDPEMQEFFQSIEDLPADLSRLRLIMDQHRLKGSDLQEEIGSKSLVSQILNGKRQLTRNHIEKLSARFDIHPGSFFS